jgi:hypothetical protein
MTGLLRMVRVGPRLQRCDGPLQSGEQSSYIFVRTICGSGGRPRRKTIHQQVCQCRGLHLDINRPSSEDRPLSHVFQSAEKHVADGVRVRTGRRLTVTDRVLDCLDGNARILRVHAVQRRPNVIVPSNLLIDNSMKSRRLFHAAEVSSRDQRQLGAQSRDKRDLALQVLKERCGPFAQHLIEQVLPILEVLVHRRLGNSGPARDLRHRYRCVAALLEQGTRRGNYLFRPMFGASLPRTTILLGPQGLFYSHKVATEGVVLGTGRIYSMRPSCAKQRDFRNRVVRAGAVFAI